MNDFQRTRASGGFRFRRRFFIPGKGLAMEEKNRITLLGIIVEDVDATETINQLLHENRRYIVGRMGIPYRQRNLAIISVVLDSPQDVTSALSGKLGMLPGVSVKAVYSKN